MTTRQRNAGKANQSSLLRVDALWTLAQYSQRGIYMSTIVTLPSLLLLQRYGSEYLRTAGRPLQKMHIGGQYPPACGS